MPKDSPDPDVDVNIKSMPEETPDTPAEERETARQQTAEDVESALRAEGQRAINTIWENTQMKIALSVVWMALLVSSSLAVGGKFMANAEVQVASGVFLYGVANLVVGFYFGRTNHSRTGGVGGDSEAPRK